MVSVWADDEPQRMAAAVGAYDGRAFTAATWQRFTATDTLYAATTFLDADGRRCAISWAREPGTAGDGWAGLLALPVVLSLDGDRLVPALHPAVDSLRITRIAAWGETPLTMEPVRLAPVPPFLDLDLAVAEGPVRIGVVTEDAEVMALVVDPDAGVVLVSRPGADDERIPLGRDTDGDVPVRLLLDAGLAEIFTAVDAGAVRAASGEGAVSLVMTAPDGTARLRRLALFDMPSG
jgi:beta-fructofuranosidase